MAEKEATSSHLDSMIHAYTAGPLLGSTARLWVDTWDRNTVADGYWQTVNTIQPLINRDIYLADAIDKLATKYTRYNEGFGIDITPYGDSYKISVNSDDVILNSPHYIFDNNYFSVDTDVETNTQTVGMKFHDNSYITADEQGIYCNVDKLLYDTTNLTSYSAITANKISAFTYNYSTTSADIVVSSQLEPYPSAGVLYFIG